jgi:hypothetical protein
MSYAVAKYPKITWNTEHTHWICPQTLTELCRRAGLKPKHCELIPDYADGSTSATYRAFVRAMTLLGPVIPERLRNSSILCVAEHAEACDLRPYRAA